MAATTAMAAALVWTLAADQALAQATDACGPLASDGTVTCTTAGNPYPDGIAYSTPSGPPVVDLTVVLDPGVEVRLADPGTPRAGIALRGQGGGAATLRSGAATRVETRGDSQPGVAGLADAGALDLEVPDITTLGQGSLGVDARTTGGGSVAVETRAITTRGDVARGVYAHADGGGDVWIGGTGPITTHGERSTGLVGFTSAGAVTVEAGDISTFGYASEGVVAVGHAVSLDLAGQIRIAGPRGYGVYAAAGNGPAMVTLSGAIETERFAAWGASVAAVDDAMLVGGGTIVTHGEFARGAWVVAHDGDAIVDLTRVATTADSATAIAASSDRGDASVSVDEVTTEGDYSNAIQASSGYGDVSVDAEAVTTEGASSTAIVVLGRGTTDVRVGSVDASGADSSAIVATGDAVNVIVSGTAATSGDSSRTGGGFYRSTIYAGAGSAATVLNYGAVTSSGLDTAAITVSGGNEAVVAGGGTVATRGNGAFGIRAQSDYGTTLVAQSGVTTEGAGATAIDVTSAGRASVYVGSVATIGDRSTGIAFRGSGAIVIDAGQVTTRGAGSRGIDVEVDGGAYADIRVASVSTGGDQTPAIFARSAGDGAITIDAGSLATTGRVARGVHAESAGALDVTVDSVATSGERSEGLLLIGRGAGNIVARAGSIVTTGARARGAQIVALQADVTVTAGAVTTADAEGLVVGARNADVTVTGPVAVAGLDAIGVYAVAFGGNASVATEGPISASGTRAAGVVGGSDRDVTLVTRGHVFAAGSVSSAVTALAEGNITIDAASVENGGGTASRGIETKSNVGDIEIRLGSARVSGNGTRGVSARTFTGNISVAVAGRIDATGLGASGVYVESAGRAVVEVNDIALAGYYGSAVVASGAEVAVTLNGAIRSESRGNPGESTVAVGAATTATIVNNGSIEATSAGGIRISGGSDVVVSGSGSVRAAGSTAIRAQAGGAIAISQQNIETGGIGAVAIAAFANGNYEQGTQISFGRIDQSGIGGAGVDAFSAGAIRVAGGTIVRTGGGGDGARLNSLRDVSAALDRLSVVGVRARGIYANAGFAAGSVDIALGQAAAAGDRSLLVDARARAGSVAVTVGDANISGDRARGIVAAAAQDATVTVTGSFTGSASQAAPDSAMIAVTGYGTAALVNNGAIRTSGTNQTAVEARGYAGANVSGSGSIVTTGDGADAVYAGSNTRVASVRQASVRTEGDDAQAIIARSYGTVEVDVGSVSTLGDGSTAILAEGAEGAAVRAGTVSTAGAASDGVVVRSYGPVSVSVGSVTALGLAARAIFAESAMTASVAIAAGGIVEADGDDTLVLSGAGGSSLVNDGTLLGGGGYALRALGGPVSIVNRGTIGGALLLTLYADRIANAGLLVLDPGTGFEGGDDRLDNEGTLLLAGNVDFGAGADSLVNNGAIAFASAGGVDGAPRARTLAGLEAFANSGDIDLINGIAGDRLTTTGSFAGSGDSRLGIDVRLGSAAAADRLVIGGAATGSTDIALNLVGSGDPAIQPGIVLVQAGAGTSADAFAVDPASRFRGFMEFGLVHDAAAGTFSLVGAPAPAAYRLLKLGEGARSLWLGSADAVAAHLATLRDVDVPARGLWFEASGGAATRREVRSFSNFGLGQTVDLGYRQDGFGGQIGLDLGRGALRFGLTGGYQSSVMHFAAGDRATFDAYNGGLYASLQSGGFHMSALAKIDGYRIRTSLASIGASDRFGGTGHGLRVEAGYRLGSDRFFVEPSLSLSWLRADLDDTGAFGARVDFAGQDGLRGAAGLRLGSRREIGSGQQLTLYAGLGAVREFEGQGRIAFTTGATSLAFDNQRLGIYGTGRLGLSVGGRGVTGFIEAEGRHGDGYRAGGARVGLRFGF